MAAGDLLTNDWQLELRGLLMGYGTSYQFGAAGIGGLHGTAKVRQVSLAHDDGSYAATDLLTERIITVPITILGSSPSNTMDLFDALETAWAPGEDVELHGQLPGWNHWKVTGRSRPAASDWSQLRASVIEGLYEFHALDPAITTDIV
jgi:hypothetical protein